MKDDTPKQSDQDQLYDDITAAIARFPELSVYTTLGVLEVVKFSIIERIPQ